MDAKYKLGLKIIDDIILAFKDEICNDEDYLKDEETGEKIKKKDYTLSEKWCAKDLPKKKKTLQSLLEIKLSLTTSEEKNKCIQILNSLKL